MSKISGNNIPPEYIGAVEKAFHEACEKGPLTGYPVINFRYVLEDGATHVVDSSSTAFGIATRYSFQQAMLNAQATLLEPIMNVEVTVHKSIYSAVMAGINKRNGTMTNTESKGDMVSLVADVPLREMFGYAMELRGLTSGEGEFAMEYKRHLPMSPFEASAAMEKHRKRRFGNA